MSTVGENAKLTVRLFGEIEGEIKDNPLAKDAVKADPTEFLLQTEPTSQTSQKAEELQDLQDLPDESEVQLSIQDTKAFEDFVRKLPTKRSAAGVPVADVSVDFPLVPMDAASGQHWNVGSGGTFGSRSLAEQTLKANLPAGWDGGDVGVIILDVGVNLNYINSIAGEGQFGGGWQRYMPSSSGSMQQVGQYRDPHMKLSDGHGNMIARNVLSIAPAATIYDAPILPDRVLDIQGFASNATRILNAIRRVIVNPMGNPNFPKHKHWILVNAWAVATSFADAPGEFSYAENRKHRLNAKFIELAQMDNVDVVFAAGNNGGYAPAFLTGPYDRGHARSIWGANGLEEVFSIGGVRADGMPIGASSQGPSRENLMTALSGLNEKPDFSCPSWFSEDANPCITNTGSSAASAMFAGYLAAYRGANPVPAGQSKNEALAELKRPGAEWNAQTGYCLPKTDFALV